MSINIQRVNETDMKGHTTKEKQNGYSKHQLETKHGCRL